MTVIVLTFYILKWHIFLLKNYLDDLSLNLFTLQPFWFFKKLLTFEWLFCCTLIMCFLLYIYNPASAEILRTQCLYFSYKPLYSLIFLPWRNNISLGMAFFIQQTIYSQYIFKFWSVSFICRILHSVLNIKFFPKLDIMTCTFV